eukprot:jgi/Galph1/871/GphlegSOOS_G5634.1
MWMRNFIVPSWYLFEELALAFRTRIILSRTLQWNLFNENNKCISSEWTSSSEHCWTSLCCHTWWKEPQRYSRFYFLQHRKFCSSVLSEDLKVGKKLTCSSKQLLNQLDAFLASKELSVLSSNELYLSLRVCPFCPPNYWKRVAPRIYRTDGRFHCASCDESYTLEQFLERLDIVNGTSSSEGCKILFDRTTSDERWLIEFVKDSVNSLGTNKEAKSALEDMGLSYPLLRDFEVGIASFRRNETLEDFIIFPLKDENCRLIGMKCRRVQSYEEVGYYRLSTSWGLFGAHVGDSRIDAVIVTDDELEAMKVYDACGIRTVSLPLGTWALHEESTSFLERYSKVYIWFGNEPISKERAYLLAKKVGPMKCYIICPPEKLTAGAERPSDLIRMKIPIVPFISSAELAIQPKVVSSASTHRNHIYQMLTKPQQHVWLSTTCQSLPRFSHLFKGFRRNETSLFVGESGVGKSTFLCQLVMDFSRQGIETLWCSFSSDEPYIVKTMLHQLSKVDAKRLADNYSYYYSILESLPLHFMNLTNRQDFEYLENAIEYALHAWKVSLMVVDNLNVLSSFYGEYLMSSVERLEKSVHFLKEMANKYNIHIVATTFPLQRLPCQELDISVEQLFGMSSVSCEADNIFLITRNHSSANGYTTSRRISLLKNKWNGTLGGIEYRQHIETKCLVEEGRELENPDMENADIPNHSVGETAYIDESFGFDALTLSSDMTCEESSGGLGKGEMLVDFSMNSRDLSDLERVLDIRD